MFRVKQPELHENGCKPCSAAAASPVCGSDGHNYASEVKYIYVALNLPFECTLFTFYLDFFFSSLLDR